MRGKSKGVCSWCCCCCHDCEVLRSILGCMHILFSCDDILTTSELKNIPSMFREWRDGTGTKTDRTKTYHHILTTNTSFHRQHLSHGHPDIRKHSGYQYFIALATSYPWRTHVKSASYLALSFCSLFQLRSHFNTSRPILSVHTSKLCHII